MSSTGVPRLSSNGQAPGQDAFRVDQNAAAGVLPALGKRAAFPAQVDVRGFGRAPIWKICVRIQ